jgi:hypothetical protein
MKFHVSIGAAPLSDQCVFRGLKKMTPVYTKDMAPANIENWTAEHRLRSWLWAGLAGVGLKRVLPAAAVDLDETDLLSLVKRLARGASTKSEPPIDLWICMFWDGFDASDPAWSQIPPLCRWNSESGGEFISFMLSQRGISYTLSAGAYRKRIERLQRAGVKLNRAKEPFAVTGAEFKQPNILRLTVHCDKTQRGGLSVAGSMPARFNAANGPGKITKNNSRANSRKAA